MNKREIDLVEAELAEADACDDDQVLGDDEFPGDARFNPADPSTLLRRTYYSADAADADYPLASDARGPAIARKLDGALKAAIARLTTELEGAA